MKRIIALDGQDYGKFGDLSKWTLEYSDGNKAHIGDYVELSRHNIGCGNSIVTKFGVMGICYNDFIKGEYKNFSIKLISKYNEHDVKEIRSLKIVEIEEDKIVEKEIIAHKNALELDIQRIENIVLVKILHQNNNKIKRGLFRFKYKDFRVESCNTFALDSSNILYLHGNSRNDRKSYFPYSFESEEQAIEYVEKMIMAIKQLNYELSDDYIDWSKIEVDTKVTITLNNGQLKRHFAKYIEGERPYFYMDGTTSFTNTNDDDNTINYYREKEIKYEIYKGE